MRKPNVVLSKGFYQIEEWREDQELLRSVHMIKNYFKPHPNAAHKVSEEALKERPFWHAVYSEVNRYSLGYRIIHVSPTSLKQEFGKKFERILKRFKSPCLR